MGAIITWIISKVGFTAFKKGLLISVAIVYYSVVISFYLFLADAVLKVYNLITNLFSYITSFSSSSNDVLSLFFSFLSCSGILPALNDSKSIFLGAVSLYLVRISYSYMLSLKTRLFDISSKVLE